MSYFKIKCPGKRNHHKKAGNNLIIEQNCGMLLGFKENNSNTESTDVYYCRNCKRLVKAQITKDTEIVSLTMLPKGTKLDLVNRSFTTDEY
jgi:hypothetical protein